MSNTLTESTFTLADYNFRVSGQPYEVLGLLTCRGNVFCADCTSHVLMVALEANPQILPIFRDLINVAELQVNCDGCDKELGK